MNTNTPQDRDNLNPQEEQHTSNMNTDIPFNSNCSYDENWAENQSKQKKDNIVEKSTGSGLSGVIEQVGKKKFLSYVGASLGALVFIFVMLLLTFGFHIWGNHDWVAATCETAKYCKGCHKIEGEPLGHDWKNADCTNPRTCAKCGITAGVPTGHKWVGESCDSPRTCSVCGTTEGTPLGHDWVNKDCTKPLKCSRCDKEKENKGKHKWKDATCTEPKTCSECGKTDGDKLGHDWNEATCKAPKTCDRCGKTEGTIGNHVYTDATLTDPETCIYCGRTEGRKLDYRYLGVGVIITDEVSGLNLRKKPENSADVIMGMNETTALKVYDCNDDDWYYVQNDDKYGYAKSEFITLIPKTYYSSSYHKSYDLDKIISVNVDDDIAFETIAFYGNTQAAVIFDKNDSKKEYESGGYGFNYHLIKDDNTDDVFWGRELNYDGSDNRSLERELPTHSIIASYGLKDSKMSKSQYDDYLSNVTFIEENVYSGCEYNKGHWLDYAFSVSQ